MSEHYEHMDACAKCDEEWPCRDQLFDDIDRLTAALAAMTQERDALREQMDAARENRETALSQLQGRVQHWMDRADAARTALDDEKAAHARTQEWLDKFLSDAASQQVRAIRAEQTLAKERDALLAPGADAGADLPPMSPPAAYPATLEITDVRAGRPLPPDADDTRAAREEGS